MKDFFPRIAGCEFIQMNRRSASFECWVYHFELNNPLSACISYSNKSMKREIWKLNLKTRKKIFSQLLAISECDYTRWKNGSFNKTSKLKKIQKSTSPPPHFLLHNRLSTVKPSSYSGLLSPGRSNSTFCSDLVSLTYAGWYFVCFVFCNPSLCKLVFVCIVSHWRQLWSY